MRVCVLFNTGFDAIDATCTGGVGAGRELYRIGALDAAAADQLVRCVLPDLHDDGVASLVTACSHLPLALRVAGTALSLPTVDAGRLFERLTTADGLDAAAAASAAAGVDRHLVADDQLERHRLRRVVDCVGKVLDAVCGPAGAVMSLVARTACFAGSGFDADEAAAMLDGADDVGSVRSTLDRLADLGLVARLSATTPRYRWRSLVGAMAASTLGAGEAAACEQRYRGTVISRLLTAAARYHQSADDCYAALHAVDVEFDNIVDVLWRTLDREDAFRDLAGAAALGTGAFLSDVLPDELFVALYEAVDREAAERDGAAQLDNGTAAVRSGALSCLSYRHSSAGRRADAVSCAERALELAAGGEAAVSALFCLSRALKTGAGGTLTTAAGGERGRRALSTARQAYDACKASGLVVPDASTCSIAAVYAVEWYAALLTHADNFQTARHWYDQRC